MMEREMDDNGDKEEEEETRRNYDDGEVIRRRRDGGGIGAWRNRRRGRRWTRLHLTDVAIVMSAPVQ